MSGLITGNFVFSVEQEYRVLMERNYLKLAQKLWYPRLTKVHDTDSKSEIFEWLLQTATIDQLSPQDGGEESGNLNFEEISSCLKTIAPAHHGKGYRIDKMRWENSLNRGMDPVGEWIAAQSHYAGYYPQKQIAIRMMLGQTINSYDNVPFFSKVHPCNPNIPKLGTYANLFTGAAVVGTPGVVGSGYPGALPIDDSVTMDVAVTNLSKAIAYVTGSITQPNGQDSRNLEVAYLIHPPRMAARVHQLLDTQNVAKYAKVIAQAAAGGGAGSADIGGVIESFGLAEPVRAVELDGNRSFQAYLNGPEGAPQVATGSDTTYYLVCKEAEQTELGAMIMNLRQPFKMTFYSGEAGAEGIDAVLGRSQKMEWQHHAYMGFDVGHPFAMHAFLGA